MSEISYRWTRQYTMSAQQIKELKRNMKLWRKKLPEILDKAEKSSYEDQQRAEEQLGNFLNSY